MMTPRGGLERLQREAHTLHQAGSTPARATIVTGSWTTRARAR